MKRILTFSFICVFIPVIHGETQNITCALCHLGETQCAGTNCTADACITLTQVNTLGGIPNGTYRGCSDQNDCRPLAFTLTTSDKRQIQSSSACCTTNECNQELTLSVPPTSALENGVHCPVCENYNQTMCTSNTDIACRGAEVKCITLAGNSIVDEQANFTLRGCATPNTCELVEGDLVPFGDSIYRLSTPAVCTDKGALAAVSSPMVIIPAIAGFLLVNVFS